MKLDGCLGHEHHEIGDDNLTERDVINIGQYNPWAD